MKANTPYSNERMRKQFIQVRYDFKSQMQEKTWKKTIEKLSFAPEYMTYYDQLPFKPGALFWKAIVESKLPLKNLRFTIPETIGLFEEKFYLSTHPIKGHLVLSNEFKDSDVLDKCENILKEIYKKDIDPQNPCMVVRSEGYLPTNSEKSIIQWGSHKDEIGVKIQGNTVAQQFIHSFGGKAACVRFVYNNPSCSSGQVNWGLNMCNKIKIEIDYQEYQYGPNGSFIGEKPPNVNKRAFLCPEDQNSFDVYEMKGQGNFHEYEDVCAQLCNMITKTYGIRMKQLVADFMKDTLGRLIFIGVKAFQVDDIRKVEKKLTDPTPMIEHTRQNSKDSTGSDDLQQKTKQLEEKTQNLLQCKLCQLFFKKKEVEHQVTHKMIQTLKAHFNKRGLFKFEHLNRFKDPMRTSLVCDLCYMIIIAEHELIKVSLYILNQKTEEQLARTQSIPVINSDTTDEELIYEEQKRKHALVQKKITSDSFKHNLIQWRIMFYFSNLMDISQNQLDQVLNPGDQVFLQIKIQDYITRFEMKNIKNKKKDQKPPSRRPTSFSRRSFLSNSPRRPSPRLSPSRTKAFTQDLYQDSKGSAEWDEELVNLSVNKLRVHYFFTENYNIQDFLQNTEIEVRLTIGPEWSQYLAIGICHPFKFMSNSHVSERVLMQSSQIQFFSKKLKNFVLNMTTGLKTDQEIQTEQIDLYQYNGVYFPDNTYYNCDPLPIEWLEMFEGKDILNNLMSEENTGYIETGFTPFSTQKELNYLTKSSSFLNKVNFTKSRYLDYKNDSQHQQTQRDLNMTNNGNNTKRELGKSDISGIEVVVDKSSFYGQTGWTSGPGESLNESEQKKPIAQRPFSSYGNYQSTKPTPQSATFKTSTNRRLWSARQPSNKTMSPEPEPIEESSLEELVLKTNSKKTTTQHTRPPSSSRISRLGSDIDKKEDGLNLIINEKRQRNMHRVLSASTVGSKLPPQSPTVQMIDLYPPAKNLMLKYKKHNKKKKEKKKEKKLAITTSHSSLKNAFSEYMSNDAERQQLEKEFRKREKELKKNHVMPPIHTKMDLLKKIEKHRTKSKRGKTRNDKKVVAPEFIYSQTVESFINSRNYEGSMSPTYVQQQDKMLMKSYSAMNQVDQEQVNPNNRADTRIDSRIDSDASIAPLMKGESNASRVSEKKRSFKMIRPQSGKISLTEPILEQRKKEKVNEYGVMKQ